MAVRRCTCGKLPMDYLQPEEEEPVDPVDPEVAEKMETGFENLSQSDSPSLLKKYLTDDIFKDLKTKKTSYGATLLDCIQSGLENLDSHIGIYASDPEAYQVFNQIFDPIIEDYHNFDKCAKQPSVDWGNYRVLEDLDPEGDYIVSTRIRCARSIANYPLNPMMTEQQYKEIEQKVSDVVKALPNEYTGEYYTLGDMSDEDKQKLIDNHYLFKECDQYLQSANACRFWPTGRGIYYNKQKTFLVWVNEEDHIRVISMQPGGHMGQVYGRLVNGICEIGRKIDFVRDERLGFLTFCPTNLGTTIRASVHAKLPKLAERGRLQQLANQYDLDIRGTSGEHSETQGGVYDISNKQRLGIPEFRLICETYSGIKAVLKMEMCL